MNRIDLAAAVILACTACDESVSPHLKVVHEGGVLDGGGSWAEAIHEIQGSITITGGPLKIAPCSVVQMAAGTVLRAQDGGSFDLVGTEDCPITITSGQAVKAPGDWQQLEILASAANSNVLDWVIIEYGGGSSYGAVWLDADTSLSMSHSVVRDSGHAGLRLYDGARFDAFDDNTLVDNAAGALHIFASAAADLGVGTYSPNAIEGILIAGGTVATDATWLAHDTPYVLDSDVNVDGGSGSARLTVAAGATLALGDSCGLNVRTNGGLTLAGSSTAPVTITSAKPVPAAGDWGDIELYGDSVGAYNDFDHAVIEYGGGSSYGAIWLDNGALLAMTDSIVRHSGNAGLRLYDGAELREFAGNSLIDNVQGPIELYANAVDDLGYGAYAPNDIDGIRIVGGIIDHDCDWLALDAPYILESSVTLETSAGGSAHVTVLAGATLEVGVGRNIHVRTNGGLSLAGTAANHVTVTSAAAVPASGDWNEIDLYGDSIAAHNVFAYADIEYGGGSSYGQLWVDDGTGVTLDNVTFSNAGNGCDVDKYTTGTVTDQGGSTFTYCN